jgi:hypothetical protein
MLPDSVVEPLKRQLERVKALHELDLADGYGDVELPEGLARKYPRAVRPGVEVRVPSLPVLDGSTDRCHSTASCLRRRVDPRREGRITRRWNSEARELSLAKLSIDIVLHLSKNRLIPNDYLLSGIAGAQLAALANGVELRLDAR